MPVQKPPFDEAERPTRSKRNALHGVSGGPGREPFAPGDRIKVTVRAGAADLEAQLQAQINRVEQALRDAAARIGASVEDAQRDLGRIIIDQSGERTPVDLGDDELATLGAFAGQAAAQAAWAVKVKVPVLIGRRVVMLPPRKTRARR